MQLRQLISLRQLGKGRGEFCTPGGAGGGGCCFTPLGQQGKDSVKAIHPCCWLGSELQLLKRELSAENVKKPIPKCHRVS